MIRAFQGRKPRAARRPGRSARSVLLLGILSGLVTGCALLPGRTASDPFTTDAPEADMVTVEVRNEHESDAIVYALWSGDRHRIGFVAAGDQERFRIRWRSPELGFHVELANGRHFATQPILMARRGSIHVRIPDTLPSGR